jgi:hypothetical protein
MEKSGIFSLIEINDKESSLLLAYLRTVNKTPAYDFISYLIGIEYLQFLDLLAGNTLKVPSRKSLFRDLEYIKIYNYVREKKFTIESVRTVAKLYNKNISFVKRAVIKISKSLNETLPMSIEELNSIRGIIDDNNCIDKGYNSCQDEWNFEEKGEILNE